MDADGLCHNNPDTGDNRRVEEEVSYAYMKKTGQAMSGHVAANRFLYIEYNLSA